jgi:hypothetical protein
MGCRIGRSGTAVRWLWGGGVILDTLPDRLGWWSLPGLTGQAGDAGFMSFNALHQALGRGPGPFEFEMIIEAIAQAVEEDTNLDWKQALPSRGERDEFAKDTAAMANSGGGVIVFGVKEVDGPSSAAGSVSGVTGWGDGEARRLRQIAYSAIQPPVHGLVFESVEQGGVTVVALSVPSSPEAPHLVWQNNGFVPPIRYGAQTEFMRERDLEQAYRRRFSARDDFGLMIEERARQVVDGLNTDERVWLVGTAVPSSPRPAHLPRVSRDEARDILMAYMPGTPFSNDDTGTQYINVNPRAGLRRWRFFDEANGQIKKVVEVHDDGGLTFAQVIEATRSSTFGRSDLHPRQVQQFIGNFVWLNVLAARALQVDVSYVLRFTIEWQFPGPVHIRRFQDGYLTDATDADAIHRFIPVEVSIEPGQPDDALLQVVRDAATDVMNQGGIWDIGTTYLKPVPVEQR